MQYHPQHDFKIKVTDFEFYNVSFWQSFWWIWFMFGINEHKILKCFRKEKHDFRQAVLFGYRSYWHEPSHICSKDTFILEISQIIFVDLLMTIIPTGWCPAGYSDKMSVQGERGGWCGRGRFPETHRDSQVGGRGQARESRQVCWQRQQQRGR